MIPHEFTSFCARKHTAVRPAILHRGFKVAPVSKALRESSREAELGFPFETAVESARK